MPVLDALRGLRLHLARETWEDQVAPLACHSRLTVLRMRGASTQQAISLRILFRTSLLKALTSNENPGKVAFFAQCS